MREGVTFYLEPMTAIRTGRPALSDDKKREIASRFVEFRKKHWPTQEAAAKALGIKREMVVKYENGNNQLSGATARAPFVMLGWPSDALGQYLDGQITLVQLDARRVEPGGRPVIDFTDPEQWARAVRGIGLAAGHADVDVEAFIASEMKARQLTRADQISTALASFVRTLHIDGDSAPSEDPPFLKAKRKRS